MGLNKQILVKNGIRILKIWIAVSKKVKSRLVEFDPRNKDENMRSKWRFINHRICHKKKQDGFEFFESSLLD